MDIFYDTLIEMGHLKEVKMATKEDIKMVLEMMNKRFEALDNRFEGINKRFALMFTFMHIGIGILVLLTVLFKFPA